MYYLQLESLSGPMTLGGDGRFRMTSFASCDLLTMASLSLTAVCIRRTLEDDSRPLLLPPGGTDKELPRLPGPSRSPTMSWKTSNNHCNKKETHYANLTEPWVEDKRMPSKKQESNLLITRKKWRLRRHFCSLRLPSDKTAGLKYT